MSGISPRFSTAGQREAGGVCAHCGGGISVGEALAICSECGELHHVTCWQSHERCGSYECSAGHSKAAGATIPAISISKEELAAATPLPSRNSSTESSGGGRDPGRATPRWDRPSVAAFIVALLGIPLFGLITGMVAVVVACVALAGRRHATRGAGLAVAAILIGLGEIVGWAIGLAWYVGTPQPMVALDSFAIDPASFENLPEPIARAMRANVVIQSSAGLGRESLGSGVVLSVRDGLAYIVTNRHVVDADYSDSETAIPDDMASLGRIVVRTLNDSSVAGKLEWIAPGGVDLAIISARVPGMGVVATRWDPNCAPKISDNVFAIGNPHGLGWTHSAGDISQIRRRVQGGYAVRILQTTAAINPGNSGGGLYDEHGRLLGINTLTGDKQWAEGLGFAIALPTLLDLAPPHLVSPSPEDEASSE